MIDQEEQVKLVDYNLALLLPESMILSDAELIGTAGFAAPEQYIGVVSPQVDIYALGATLHYLLTGRNPRLHPPFSFGDVPPSSLNPKVSQELDAVILRAVAYHAERRHASAGAMRDALQACL